MLTDSANVTELILRTIHVSDELRDNVIDQFR